MVFCLHTCSCEHYGEKKISRLDAALAMQTVGISQSQQSDKLKQFFTSIAGYIESEQPFISKCFKYNPKDINQIAFIFETSFLFLACQWNQITLVENLLADKEIKKIKKIKVNQAIYPAHIRVTSLYIAAQNGHTAIVKLLLSKRHIKVNLALKNGATPLIQASQNGHAPCVQLLLAAPEIKVNQTIHSTGVTALFLASKNGRAAVVELLLNHPGININQADVSGVTPLFIASDCGDVVILQHLISRGALVDESMHASTKSLLTIAEKTGKHLALKALLRLKNNGETPEYISGFTPLHAAIFLGFEKCVECLITADANIHSTTGGLSCLDLAKIMGDDKIICLIENSLNSNDLILSESNQANDLYCIEGQNLRL